MVLLLLQWRQFEICIVSTSVMFLSVSRQHWWNHYLVRDPRGGLRDDTLPEQQVLRRWPRSQLLRECRVGLRPARPGLAGAGRLRQGSLHVNRGSGAQGKAQGIRREGGARDLIAGTGGGSHPSLPSDAPNSL